MQRDVSIPLLINQHGNDEICDQINVLGLAEAKQPRALKLSPVNPNGSSWYKIQDESLPDDADCFTPTTMQPPITQPVRPNPICMLTSMRRVVPGRSEGRPPALYALRPTNASTGECTGEYWELVGVADPGWICVAARAVDTKGNVGVSEPVRLCYGENPNMTPDCSGMPMPSCTDGCTISEAQKFHPDEGSWYFP
jgi:hypothetical protein